MKKTFKNIIAVQMLLSAVVILGVTADPVRADDVANQASDVLKEPDKEWKVKNSLFFLPNEIVAIVQAKKGIIKSEESYSDKPTTAGDRYISLSGISYVDNNNWIIWLNGKKITPKNIPEEIIELIVHKDYIDLKWHDVEYHRVVVFRMQPRQRFHLDTGMILPG